MQLYELSIIPIIVSFLLIAMMNKHDKKIKLIALIGSLTPLLFLPYMVQGMGTITNLNWFAVGSTTFGITLSLLPINVLLFAIVSIMGPLIILYSWGYMNNASEDKAFYIEMLAFETAMLAFSISGNFIPLFIAWEFLSLTSYLLIGFYGKFESLRAARKAVTVILAGDIALLAGMILLWSVFSTFQFSALLAMVQGGSIGIRAQIAMLLILIAIMTKSAQFPFSNWLPDAMEGPTPVSAFLHSSTMVKAGVFLVFVLFGLFAASNLLPVILIVGIITALLAVSNALYETHIKRILAYSTIEELSLMLVALGLGGFAVALYLFIVQTFYKALLFFYAGIQIKATSTEDIYKMRDADKNKFLFAAAAIGVVSLAGFIPFSGFFGNVSLEGTALSTSLPLYAILLLIDFSVALFITRWFVVPAKRESNKKAASKLAIDYSLTKKSMKIAMYILAILTLLSIITVLYVSSFAAGMSGYGYLINSTFNINPIGCLVAAAVVAIGIYAGYNIFYKKQLNRDALSRILNNNGFTSKIFLYATYFVYDISVVLSNFDMRVSDVFDEIGQGASHSGRSLRKLQNGQINFYAIMFIIGILALLAYLIWGII